MTIRKSRPCPCGSGQESTWQYDARGLPLARTCVECHTRKMDAYRADVITDANYWHDEPIEED
jgi:hypothetical protein